MTKKKLLEALKDLDDGAQIHIYCTSLDLDIGEYADDIYFDDIVTGKELQNEITIVAHF